MGLDERPGPGRAGVLVSGLDHPEGVAYDPAAEAVYAGGEAGQIYRVDLLAPAPAVVGRAPGAVLGLALDGRGRLAACVSEGRPCLCAGPPDGLRPLLEDIDGEPLRVPDCPAFGPDGTLWLTDSGGWQRGEGKVVRLQADGAAEVHSTALERSPKGCAVSPDGRWLWVAESETGVIARFDLRGGGPPETVTRLAGHVVHGLAFTAEGGLLISNHRPDSLCHLDADGHVEVVAEDPQGALLSSSANVVFVDADLDRVVVANLGRRHLTMLDLGIAGAPLHRPRRWALDAYAAAPTTAEFADQPPS